MPELPDVTVYVERIAERVVGRALERVRLASPFVLRTAVPPVSATFGRRALSVRRLGKRIVFELEGELFIVIHLMIAGRFRWLEPGVKIPGKLSLAALDFDSGSLILTEASSKKRASLHVIEGRASLATFDRGGLELGDATPATYRAAMTRENHTLKRALTDPTILSGVGNAYSDEILHLAKLSPVQQTKNLDEHEWQRLFDATQSVMEEWVARLREESVTTFPEKVTAFREQMAVHGKFAKPCPVCGTRVQRIRYADNETNYCPTCQTGGKLLADRGLSRLLGKDWPKTLEELEDRKAGVEMPATRSAKNSAATKRE